MNAWLIIGLAVVAMWALFGMLNLVFDLIERWQAARKGEAGQATKGKGSFS